MRPSIDEAQSDCPGPLGDEGMVRSECHACRRCNAYLELMAEFDRGGSRMAESHQSGAAEVAGYAA